MPRTSPLKRARAKPTEGSVGSSFGILTEGKEGSAWAEPKLYLRGTYRGRRYSVGSAQAEERAKAPAKERAFYRGPEIPCLRIIRKCASIKLAARSGRTKVCKL